jgi:hypothetical protein
MKCNSIYSLRPAVLKLCDVRPHFILHKKYAATPTNCFHETLPGLFYFKQKTYLHKKQTIVNAIHVPASLLQVSQF